MLNVSNPLFLRIVPESRAFTRSLLDNVFDVRLKWTDRFEMRRESAVAEKHDTWAVCAATSSRIACFGMNSNGRGFLWWKEGEMTEHCDFARFYATIMMFECDTWIIQMCCSLSFARNVVLVNENYATARHSGHCVRRMWPPTLI